ncbi:hypothetical protein GDO86_012721 [Hymenochirus boettgeri]|uniref:5-hydroxytryptamine receptor 3A n=1 Tax=Hymenochirus boettgeri TaxID=247094 RepID=A0A8T2IRR0_9PIPI|nr:hypothetical protein GDO86_012721 [Hymenochirus boettgeri]
MATTILLNFTSIVHGNWSVKMNNSTLRSLSDYLLKDYEMGVRPVKDWRKATTVYIDIVIYAILGVDEKNQLMTTCLWYTQSWTDEFLSWDTEMFENIKQISVPSKKVWTPDIVIQNLVDTGKSSEIPYIYINHEGRVIDSKPIQAVTTCSLNIYYFPFDVQTCKLTFSTWIHSIDYLNISLIRSAEEVKKDQRVFLNNGEWELLNVLSKYNLFKDTEEHFAELIFTLVIKRRPLFYVVNLLLPSAFLVALDSVGFYLPPESGERISFKTTVLLGYSVFLIIVSEQLPVTSKGTPLIEIYFIVCMALLVISLAESIFILQIIHKQNRQPKVPEWIKSFVLEKMPALLCIKVNKIRPSKQLVEYNNENMSDSRDTVRTILPKREDSEFLSGILKEVLLIRKGVEKINNVDAANEWLEIAYVLDVVLFRIYLLAVLAYFLCLIMMWCKWHQT